MASSRSLASFLVVASALLVTAPRARATNYFVSPSGSDSANGQSTSTAWRTLQHAADVVHAGDTVNVLAGTYVGFNLFTSGAPGAPIRFTANGGGDAPNPAVIVNGNNAFTNKDRINLEGASHVIVEGFTVIGSNDPATNRTGIRTVGDTGARASDVTIRANRCDQCGRWGILTGFVDDLLIERNECSRSVAEHGIYVGNSGDRPVVRRNHSWGNHGCGIHMNGDVNVGDEGIITGALVERNVIHGNGGNGGGGSAINCDGVQNSVIRNNVLYDNHASGISLYRIDGGGPSSGNLVVNNTVHVASDGRFALNLKNGAVQTIARNNVFVNDQPSHGAVELTSDCLPGLACDWNAVKDRFSIDDVFVSLAQWRSMTGQDAHSFIATPAQLFVAPASGDYHLKAGSPAIDAGTPTGAPGDDYEGRHRPALLGFDVGASEFSACFGSIAGYGTGKSGAGGATPELGASGCPDLGAAITLSITNGRGGAPGTLLLGTSTASTPLLGGTLLVVPTITVAFVLGGAPGAAGAGATSWPATIPSTPSLAGMIDLQAWCVDAAATFGASASAGLAISLGSA